MHSNQITESQSCWVWNIPSAIFLIRSLWTFSAPSWTITTLSASPCVRDAPSPWQSFWIFSGLAPTCPAYSDTGKPRLRNPDVSYMGWAEEKDHLSCHYLSWQWKCFIYMYLHMNENTFIYFAGNYCFQQYFG